MTPVNTHLGPVPPPTRRDFTARAITWLGFACAAACHSAAAAPAVSPAAVPGLAPAASFGLTGDAELDELRRLTNAPLAELVEHRLLFVYRLSQDYRTDPVLWRGFTRLCDAAVTDAQIPDRRLFGRLLAQVIEHGDPQAVAGLQPRVDELRRLP